MEQTELICKFFQDQLQLKEGTMNVDTPLIELGLDGFSIVNLMVQFEEQFSVTFDDEDLLKFSCVRDIVEKMETMGGNEKC